MLPYLSTEDYITLHYPQHVYAKHGVLSVCQSDSLLIDLLKSKIHIRNFFIPHNPIMVMIKQTDSGHMFVVEQTGVYALIY